MNRIRNLLSFIGILIAIFIFYVCIVLAENYLTEWSLRSRVYDVGYPVLVTEGSISEIEKQVKALVSEKYGNIYLGEITIETDTNEGFNSFSDGTVVITYCKKLDKGFVYRHERFMYCEACVDLKTKQICQIRTYGNHQLGGIKEMGSYSEIHEIRERLHRYCVNKELITQPYIVDRCYLRINYYGLNSTHFTLQLSDGSTIELKNVI